MHKALKEKAIRLRLEKQLGYSSIRKLVPVSKSTLSNWLRNFPLTEERIRELKKAGWPKFEARVEKYRATMKKKREMEDQKEYKTYTKRFSKKMSQESFFVAGLMLYLAEGSKTSNYTVSVANTDARVIKFFTKWLQVFFEVPKEKLKASLHLYENMAIEKEKDFWKNELGFDRSQFYKPYITTNKKSSFLYKESFRHGTCSVIFSNTRLKRKIMMAIKAYVDKCLGV
ncbi:MAG: hypothetical protein AAB967_02925 [Patescibacteria group bacterium]